MMNAKLPVKKKKKQKYDLVAFLVNCVPTWGYALPAEKFATPIQYKITQNKKQRGATASRY